MRLIHIINLATVGGIQRDYSHFIHTAVPGMPVEHHTVLTRPAISPAIEAAVRSGSASIAPLRHFAGIRIPRRPSFFLNLHFKSIVSRIEPDALVLWSNPRALDGYRLPKNVPVIYYEHGASWFNRGTDSIRASFASVDGVVCNSFASSRMLALKWGIPEEKIRICPNAVQMNVGTSAPARRLERGRPIVIGVAGRLEPIKGFAMAIHALARLAARGLDARLLVAGVGPEGNALKALSANLSIEHRVTFLGFVEDMSTFYGGIDLFLCPSIREPFGLVCAEAMAFGVPVVCARVDGLPEVVEHEGSGICVVPELPIAQYPDFGGRLEGIPDHIYDPVSDQVRPPKLLSPDALADCVQDLIQMPERYEAMSRRAQALVRERFDYPEHARQVLAAIESFRRRGGDESSSRRS